MEVIALASVLIAIAGGAIVGATLLRRSFRSRELPEFAIGMGLFAFAGLSRGLSLVSAVLAESIGSQGHLALLVGSAIGSGLGLTGLTLFTWRVFRPASRWAASAFGIFVLGLLVTRIGIVRDFMAVPEGQVPSFADAPLWVGLSVVLWILGYIWASGESFRYYMLMRRRRRLGLSDPVVVNRFFLWALGCGASGLISSLLIVTTAAGMDVHNDPLPQLLQSIIGISGPITWYLGFMPPAAYLDFIRRRAQLAEG